MAQGFIGAEPLPSGRYVARARIMRGDKLAGVLVRPFILEPAPASKGGPIVVPAAFARVATFDRNAVLQPALVNGMLDSIAARSPSLKNAMVEARAGRYAPAALEALDRRRSAGGRVPEGTRPLREGTDRSGGDAVEHRRRSAP